MLGKCDIVAGATAVQRIELNQGGVVQGIVRDATGTAIERADLRIGDWNDDLGYFEERSAADGTFAIAGLPIGELLLRAHHQAHGRAELLVTTTTDSATTVDVPLSRGLELRGRVLDADDQPVAEAILECMSERSGTDRWSAFVRTDANGRFTATNCPESGRVSVLVTAKGFEALRERRIDPKTTDLQFRLLRAEPATVRISARVVGPDGKPVANASVSARRRNVRGSSGMQATGNDGRFELGPLVPGTWQFDVRSEGLPEFQSEPRPLAANDHWDCGTITLAIGGTARIAVDGGKLPGAYVLVTNMARTRSWAVADIDFGYRTPALAPGDYAVLVSGPGIAAEAVPFTIRAAEAGTVSLRMQPGVAQGFRIDVPADTKADGVSLHVRRGDVFVGRIWIGLSEDRPVELSLLPGDYTVSGEIGSLRGSAPFTVGPSSGEPVTVTLR